MLLTRPSFPCFACAAFISIHAAAKWGCPFFEASAKERINNETCFFDVVREIRKMDNKPLGKQDKKEFCSLL